MKFMEYICLLFREQECRYFFFEKIDKEEKFFERRRFLLEGKEKKRNIYKVKEIFREEEDVEDFFDE